MRLAYGYAQYGYTQRRDFLCTMNGSAAADALNTATGRPAYDGTIMALLFLPAGPFMAAVRCCACRPSARSALMPGFRAQVPTAENLDSARSNVNNFAILCPDSGLPNKCVR